MILPPAVGYVGRIATVRAGISPVAVFALLLAVLIAAFLTYERRRLLQRAHGADL
jgi:hypothetical protein